MGTDRWEVESADYEICVAADVSQVKLTATVHVAGEEAVNPYGKLPGYESGNITTVPDDEFRALAKMSGGMVTEKMVDDLVFLVNGHFFRGLGRVIADFFRGIRANRTFLKQLE